ncbi:translation initiation factor IF-3 [Candidatus Woesebacteria bacterium]|nr:translation initiation factor IF-3 [Candidatus Woesebacteria bacterium]
MRIAPRRNFQRTPRKYYSINLRIEAPELRVIDAQGAQIGVLSKQEALQKAQDMGGLDLVLISAHAKPPVAKIIDFKKFLYQESKKEKEAKKGVRKSTVKDVPISLFMGIADETRLIEKTKEFLSDGNQVRINMKLVGRQMGRIPMAVDHMRKFILALGEVNVSKEPRIEGRVVRAVVARKK